MDKQFQDEIAYCAFRESNDAIFVIESRDYRVIDLNPSALRMTAMSRKTALQMTLFDLFTADAPEPLAKLIDACAKTGYFQSSDDYRLNRSDGGFVPVHVNVSRIHTTREPLGLVVARDVSERRIVQDLFDRFFQLSPALFVIFRPDGALVRVNQAWEQNLAAQPGQLRAGAPSVSDFVHPSDHDSLREAIATMGQLGLSGFECRLLHKDGTDAWYSWNIARADGLLNAVATDITHHKRYAALEQSKRDAEAANIAKGQFVAHMSHEFRTPLTAILAIAEHLAADSQILQLPADHVLDIQTIKRNGDHLLCLIDDILDLSKIERGKIRIDLERCDPAKLASEIVALMKTPAENRGLQLELDLGTSLPRTILTDEVRLRQILFNLISNAIKFTEKGSVTLRVIAETSDESDRDSTLIPLLHFEVRDEGIGMKPETLAGLFEPFQITRQPPESSRQAGAGLGLMISNRLAEMLGGTLGAESEPQKGSTFRLTIPVGPPEPEPAETSADSNTLGPQHAGHPATGPRRVLLAEDNSDNRRAISMLLTHAGHDVSTASNGQEAFEIAQAADHAGEPFDTILMDMQMPVIDGFQATRMLRDAGYKNRILALTAYAMHEDREECLRAGCNDFLSKPIDWSELNKLLSV